MMSLQDKLYQVAVQLGMSHELHIRPIPPDRVVKRRSTEDSLVLILREIADRIEKLEERVK